MGPLAQPLEVATERRPFSITANLRFDVLEGACDRDGFTGRQVGINVLVVHEKTSLTDLVSEVDRSRDDRRWTFPNDLTGIRLFHSAIAQVVEFTADEFYSLAAAKE